MALTAYRAAVPLLRIPFSLFLMPIFWFGLSALREPFSWGRAVTVFLILHLLVYPASNGYNSFYDRDEDSIGGLKTPPKVTPQLLHLVYLFDALALTGALLLGWLFALLVLIYLLISKAYSYEGIRLKKYPLLSTAVVVVFQGAFTFLLAQVGVGATAGQLTEKTNLLLALVSTLFLCGSYPLTQIYQHQEDTRRGDRTLSLRLSLIFLVATGPVVALFARWVWLAWRNPALANFEWTMRMNKVSSLCLSAAFIAMLVLSR
ncbi:MAG: prenyltransferase [Hymenobacter sp.]|nr:MAG: prenyltransferase [Hymenobacter sp.]